MTGALDIGLSLMCQPTFGKWGENLRIMPFSDNKFTFDFMLITPYNNHTVSGEAVLRGSF